MACSIGPKYWITTYRGSDGKPADLKKRNGNLDTDRTTSTKAASVRKQLGTKNSKSNGSRKAKNGGLKGRDGSAEELDR